MDKYSWMFIAILFFILMFPVALFFDLVENRFGYVGVLLAIICLFIIMGSVTFNLEISQMSDHDDNYDPRCEQKDSKENRARLTIWQSINALDFVENVDDPRQGMTVQDDTFQFRGKPGQMIAQRFYISEGGKAITLKRLAEVTDVAEKVGASYGTSVTVLWTAFADTRSKRDATRNRPGGLIITRVDD